MTKASLHLQTDIVLRVRNLGIRLLPTLRLPMGRSLLQDCSFELQAGQRLTLVGESGAGKSLLAQAIMGTLPDAMRAEGGVWIAGHETNGQRARTQTLWGRQIVMLPQEPWTALNPVMRLRTQVAEAGHFAAGLKWPAAMERADHHLKALGLLQAGRQWMHQVSGGMAQRVGIACASQTGAGVLLADEPTKGLDAGACEQVALLLTQAQQQGQALLTITHDLDLALRLGGHVAVMRHGRIVEQGEVQGVLAAPQHAYTRELIAAQPRHWPQLTSDYTATKQSALIRAEAISVKLGGRDILANASLHMDAGESVAVVGPSGCGKTTLGNALVGLQAISRGRLTRRTEAAAWRFQKLYQDPVASFSAHQSIRLGIKHLLKLHRLPETPIAHWVHRMKLSEELLDRKPDEVSGGELQRLAILRAMLLQPVFVFADEPTSRLDALTQRDTMGALCEAMAESGSAMLLVSHDADLARQSTHRSYRVVSGQLEPAHR